MLLVHPTTIRENQKFLKLEPSKYPVVRLNEWTQVNQYIKIFLALSLYNFFNISSDNARPYKGQ
jgi:hypothetical protein